MYMSTLPPPFGAFGWIYFAKIRVLYDIGICFSKKKFLFRKSNWKMAGRFALAERYLPAIMLLIV